MTKKLTNIIGMFALLAFVFLIGGTLAYWRTEGTTATTLETGGLEGTLINEYEAQSTLYPGTTLDQVIGVENSGSLDMVVRLKVDKKWNDNGSGELSDDMLEITYNSKYWIKDTDGYYYYKGILAPGETGKEPLTESITLQAEAANEYKNQTGNISVTMECLQATSDALSIWNKTYADLGVEEPKEAAPAAGDIVFTAEKEFEFSPEADKIMPYFANMTPGEVRTQTLNIENQYDGKIAFFLTLDNVDTQEQKVQEMLKKYARIKLTDKTGQEIYNGPAWSEEGKEMELATLEKGDKTSLIAMIYFDPSMENEYQNQKSEIQWKFIAQGEDAAGTGGKIASAVTGLPKTGDSYAVIKAVAVLLFLTLLAIGYLSYKQRKLSKK